MQDQAVMKTAPEVHSDVFERPFVDAVEVATFPGTRFAVTEVLEFLAFTKKTGTIRIWTPSGCIRIDIRRGHIVDLASDNAPPGQRLGEILIELGAITEAELYDYLRTSESTRQRIGRGLRKVGLINRKTMCMALMAQLRHGLARCIAATEVTVEFGPRENPYGSVDIHHDLHTALMESAAVADGF